MRSYCYKLTNIETGNFYYGFRFANKEYPMFDGYYGSSRDLSMKDKLLLQKEVLAEFFNKEDAYAFEQLLITENIKNPLCVNKCSYKNNQFVITDLWWNNGKKETRSTTSPGEGWIRGMLFQHKNKCLENFAKARTVPKIRSEAGRESFRNKRVGVDTTSAELKQRYSLLYKGIKKPPEFGKNISAKLKGVPKSEKHKINMKLGHNQPKCSCILCHKVLSNNTLKRHVSCVHEEK